MLVVAVVDGSESANEADDDLVSHIQGTIQSVGAGAGAGGSCWGRCVP